MTDWLKNLMWMPAMIICRDHLLLPSASEMRTDAVVAVVIATICMLLYIWFRFKDIRFAASAVAGTGT